MGCLGSRLDLGWSRSIGISNLLGIIAVTDVSAVADDLVFYESQTRATLINRQNRGNALLIALIVHLFHVHFNHAA